MELIKSEAKKTNQIWKFQGCTESSSYQWIAPRCVWRAPGWRWSCRWTWRTSWVLLGGCRTRPSSRCSGSTLRSTTSSCSARTSSGRPPPVNRKSFTFMSEKNCIYYTFFKNLNSFSHIFVQNNIHSLSCSCGLWIWQPQSGICRASGRRQPSCSWRRRSESHSFGLVFNKIS